MSSDFDDEQEQPRNRRLKARDDALELERHIRAQIESGVWTSGQRLPTERELQDLFGMARHNIRKTLHKFVSEGVIERRVGSGSFLTDTLPGSAGPTETARFDMIDAGPADVIELRLLFEPSVVALAVARSTNSSIERIEHCLKKGENAPDWRGFEHWDAELHLAIAEATRNPAIIQMHQTLARVRNLGEWTELKARSLTPEHRAQLQEEHAQIVQAIRVRSPSDAHKWMRQHLEHVQSYMFRMG